MIDQSTVKRVVERLKTRADYELFFERITSPEWIEPLRAEGFFAAPPDAQRTETSVSFPWWPASRYLVRMAREHRTPEAQAALLQVLMEMPSTDNDYVFDDLVEVALELPPQLAVEWAKKKAQPMIGSRHRLYHGDEQTVQLSANLARAGFIGPALGLLREIIKVYPDPTEDNDRPFGIGSPQTRLQNWAYAMVVEEHVPSVIAACNSTTVPGVQVVADALDQVLDYTRAPGEAKADDFSYIWLKSIDRAERAHGELEKSLVVALRDGCNRLVEENPERLSSVLSVLENRHSQRSIFQRLALHLVRKQLSAALDIARERLLRPRLIWDHSSWPEFANLLQDAFPLLDVHDRQQIVGNVLNGLPPERAHGDQQEDEEKRLRRKRQWQHRVLSTIRAHLEGEALEILKGMDAEFGEPDDPSILVPESTTWIGPTSPVGADDLMRMDVERIHEFLNNWNPPDTWRAPSPEGLSRILEGVVAQRADDFSAHLGELHDLDPTYVRAIISGLEEAIKKGRSIQWNEALQYCRWVVQQGHEITGPRVASTDPHDRDPNWSWTRKRVASLMGEGFKEGESSIPFELRDDAWAVLEPLTNDPEPTPAYEEEYGGSNMDPLTLSINTVRGEAMHAVVKYGLWVRRSLVDDTTQGGSFESMPEVRDVLDHHLDPDSDPSLAIRAVYGQWFPQLFVLDRSWAKQAALRVFSTEPQELERGNAAWQAYLWAQRPYDDLFDMLEWRYKVAVDRIDLDEGNGQRYDEARRLGRHIIAYYWRGLGGERGELIQAYLSKASDALRGYVISFAGREAYYWFAEGIEDVISRLVNLAEERLQAARTTGQPMQFQQEMAGFGSWYASGKFGQEWMLNLLAEATSISRKVDQSIDVLKKLAIDASKFPAQVIVCLQHILQGDEGNWLAEAHTDSVRLALSQVLTSGNEQAAQRARDLINWLGAKGLRRFFDLLQ